MSEDDDSDLDEQVISMQGLDGGTGTQCLQFGADWVTYLAGVEIPSNVSGVDLSEPDFVEEQTNV